MKWLTTISLLCLWQPSAAQPTSTQATFPQADISNGLIHARIYLPDPNTGYYRSTRFDWSGVIPSLQYKGHSYFGQWFPKYDPTINDAIMGPVESFWPLGYDQAPKGGTFVMIGIGVLTKPDTAAYNAFRYYPIRDPGIWQIKTHPSSIEFKHTLNHQYTYTKTLTLEKNELIITHALHNTGKNPIVTNVFDHNFFVTDSQTLAPGIQLKFKFTPTATDARGMDSLAAIRGDSIVLLKPFTKKESVLAVLHGYDSSADDYDIRLENRNTGAAVRIRGDKPLSRLVCWGSVHTLCPEPYIHIDVEPGKTFTWTLRYEFYTLK
jgi:hypothetical protein